MTHKKQLKHISKDLDRLKKGSPKDREKYHHIEDEHLTGILDEIHGGGQALDLDSLDDAITINLGGLEAE